MIEGRVFNPSTGEYLEFVRLTVAGTSLEAFTDSSGEFRLVNVPAGSVKLTAFRTGVAPQSQMVTVAPGQVVRQDFELSYLRPAATEGAVVKLDKFVVSTSTPLIAEVEAQLQREHGARYDEALFERDIMGCSMRTDRYRFTVWVDRRNPEGEPFAVELYDHERDPHELINLASQPENHTLVAQLRAQSLAAR